MKLCLKCTVQLCVFVSSMPSIEFTAVWQSREAQIPVMCTHTWMKTVWNGWRASWYLIYTVGICASESYECARVHVGQCSCAKCDQILSALNCLWCQLQVFVGKLIHLRGTIGFCSVPNWGANRELVLCLVVKPEYDLLMVCRLFTMKHRVQKTLQTLVWIHHQQMSHN